MRPAAHRWGQVAQVDRFVADVVEKDTIHIHQRSLVVLTIMARVPSDVASVMVRVPPQRSPTEHRAVRGDAASATCRDGGHRCCHRRLPQRRRDRFQGFVTIGTSPRNNCYERSFQ